MPLISPLMPVPQHGYSSITANGKDQLAVFLQRLMGSFGGILVKVVDLYSASTRSVSKALRYSMHCQGITVLSAHPAFHPQAE